MFYSILLFIHIVGTLLLFAAIGLEWVGWRQLRQATTTDQVRPWLAVFPQLGRMYGPAMGFILLTGIYMTVTAWGGVAWIAVAFAAMFLLPILGAMLAGSRIKALVEAVSAESGLLSDSFRQRLTDPMLVTSIRIRLAVALGIVFLMTVKPGLGGSLLVIAVAAVLGGLSALLTRSRAAARERVVS